MFMETAAAPTIGMVSADTVVMRFIRSDRRRIRRSRCWDELCNSSFGSQLWGDRPKLQLQFAKESGGSVATCY